MEWVYQVEDAAKAASVVLKKDDIAVMEKVADELGLSTIRYCEKKME